MGISNLFPNCMLSSDGDSRFWNNNRLELHVYTKNKTAIIQNVTDSTKEAIRSEVVL